jgi:hypothetical protein
MLIAAGTAEADIYNGATTIINPANRRLIGSFVYQTT